MKYYVYFTLMSYAVYTNLYKYIPNKAFYFNYNNIVIYLGLGMYVGTKLQIFYDMTLSI